MKTINIYFDDDTHRKYDKVKKAHKLTWADVLEVGINILMMTRIKDTKENLNKMEDRKNGNHKEVNNSF